MKQNRFDSMPARLSPKTAEDYIDKLRREIRRHDYLYYVEDKPEISDEDQPDRLRCGRKETGQEVGGGQC